ncbi:EthD family reductase [Acidocella aromatica]|uniref:Uncharacterized protein (TIGR02118 family) n=1 Tax=Acidocella aromatica TaxID=1303579 RepID=A0A840VBM3_9PROT|nr:EthD family reductase [Acidocella aromatica]MBB5373014.1 uncharacterized protein (TIGR02118 family) [Acidocella aromatica]
MATVKLMVFYRRPEDEAAFWTHYREVHLPLVTKIPGLQKVLVNRVDQNPMGGEPAYFMIAELHFADQAAFDAAMASPENRAAGRDAMQFAKGLFTMLAMTET